MNVARNVLLDPFLVPGGGAAEAALAYRLIEKSKTIQVRVVWVFYLGIKLSRNLELVYWVVWVFILGWVQNHPNSKFGVTNVTFYKNLRSLISFF